MEDFWFVPIGPCNYLSTDVCQWSAATLNACLMNIMTLIPMSFAYRYFVINHGTPAMRMIILIVGASLISPILAVVNIFQSLRSTVLSPIFEFECIHF